MASDQINRVLKIFVAIIFLSAIVYLGWKFSTKVYQTTKEVENASITQVSADISGACVGVGTDAPVYDFTSPQPNVPINITVKVVPVGAPLSTLAISEAEMKIISDNGTVVFDKKFNSIMNGIISSEVVFPSGGEYKVVVSAITNYGSVYDKVVGTITIFSPSTSGIITSGRIGKGSVTYTLSVPAKGLTQIKTRIIPDTGYYSHSNDKVVIYVPLTQLSSKDADKYASKVARYVLVQLAENGVNLFQAISASKVTYSVVYNYLTKSYSIGGFAVIKPEVNVIERPNEYLLTSYVVNLSLVGDTKVSALKFTINYGGSAIIGFNEEIIDMAGQMKYPVKSSEFHIYLDSKKVLSATSGSVLYTDPNVDVKEVGDNYVIFGFTRPMTGNLLVYYQLPYQTPDYVYAPIIVNGEDIDSIPVSLSYSVSSLRGVYDIATLKESSNAWSNTITLYFTRKDFEGKSVEEAVTDKLSPLIGKANIDATAIIKRVANVLKSQNVSSLAYGMSIKPSFNLIRVDGGEAYLRVVGRVTYNIEAFKVLIHASSKSVYTKQTSYPENVGDSPISVSRINFSNTYYINITPSKVSFNPSPVRVDGDVVVFKEIEPETMVSISKGTQFGAVKIPSIELNGYVITTDTIPIVEQNDTSYLLSIPKANTRIVAHTRPFPVGRWVFALYLVKSDRVLYGNGDFPTGFDFSSTFNGNIYDDYYLITKQSPALFNDVYVIGDTSASAYSSKYGAWIFRGKTEDVIFTLPDTLTGNISVYEFTSKLGEVSSSSPTISTNSINVTLSKIVGNAIRMKVKVNDPTVYELRFVFPTARGNFTAKINVMDSIFGAYVRPFSGSLEFLKFDALIIKLDPIFGGVPSFNTPKYYANVDNYLPIDYQNYLNSIVSPSINEVMPSYNETGLVTIKRDGNLLHGNGAIGIADSIMDSNSTLDFSDLSNSFLVIAIRPLKVVRVKPTTPGIIVPSITLEAKPSTIHAEANPTKDEIYTFDTHESRYRLYIEYSTTEGKRKAYLFEPNARVVLESSSISIQLSPKYYVIYREYTINVLKISSFPIEITKPTTFRVRVLASSPLFSGDVVVDSITVKPPSVIGSFLIVSKEDAKVYYSFNDITPTNVTIYDYNSMPLSLTYYIGDKMGTDTNEKVVFSIKSGIDKIYTPYPFSNPFEDGLVYIGIPITYGGDIITFDKLRSMVEEVQISYTTDFLSKTFTYNITPSNYNAFIKVLSIPKSTETYGIVVIPIDPLISASIVSNPINLNIQIKMKGGGVYSANYLIRPILAEYSPYGTYSRYAYILKPSILQGSPVLYYSEVVGKIGDNDKFISRTRINEADPSKPNYTNLIKHLKPFSLDDERWLFNNIYKYEDLTLRPDTSHGYYRIDFPNEVYVFRTGLSVHTGFYIGGASQLNFQMAYDTSGYNLTEVLNLIKTGKIPPSYEKKFIYNKKDYEIKMWFFIPSEKGVYVYLQIGKVGGTYSDLTLRVSGFGFNFKYGKMKVSVCWAYLTNTEVRGLTVSVG